MARIKDVKKLGKLQAFKSMTVEQIKKLKLNFDGKPLSNYMINKYIKPEIQGSGKRAAEPASVESDHQEIISVDLGVKEKPKDSRRRRKADNKRQKVEPEEKEQEQPAAKPQGQES